jgi:late competence protein required for DNA uptake (superfamily II DNA/RNA helicase)
MFIAETPRSEECEEESDRLVRKPLGKELRLLYQKEQSVFQSPMVQYTNRSIEMIKSHLVQ